MRKTLPTREAARADKTTLHVHDGPQVRLRVHFSSRRPRRTPRRGARWVGSLCAPPINTAIRRMRSGCSARAVPLAISPTAASCADTVAIPTAANAAPASAAAANRLNCVVDCFMAISSARVHHDIDERGLPGLDHRDRALQCGPEIFRIGNGAFAVDAKAPCDRGVIASLSRLNGILNIIFVS